MRGIERKAVDQFLQEVSRLEDRSTPQVRWLRRKLSKALADAPPSTVLAAAHRLIALKWRWVAYELVQHHPATMRTLRLKDVAALGAGMAAWDHVDTFGCCVSGPAWRLERISDSAVLGWTRSADRWWRRAALVSTVPLNVKSQGGMGDVPRTLRVCATLAGDRDDMVVKALSWALRCAVPHDSARIRKFLEDHDGVLAARVRREVTNKLETGLKNPKSATRGQDC